MSISQLKNQSKAQMKGQLGAIIITYLIVVAIYGLLSGIISAIGFLFPPAVVILSILLSATFALGTAHFFLHITYQDKPSFEPYINVVKNDFIKATVLCFLISLYTTLWSLLFVIPGIIKSYSYSQAFRIMAENPDMTPSECIKASMVMMDGHKMDLFLLQLSFILWSLLGVITFGIAMLYVYPYMSLTETNFYHSIKDQRL